VGEIAAVVRAEVSGAAEDDAAVGPLPQRSGWVLVGFGWGATVAALAAGELVEDASLPPLRGLVLVSATANGRGVSIWPALGEHVRARGVPVFAAAASRAAIDVEAQRTGMGADARTVRTIQSMFRGEAVVRIYPSGARAEALINLHVDLAPAIAGFAGDVLRPARLTAQPP
jgi:pimeloyl-ACP methyl ester carboxylesterase